jgi:hypothetical protein
MWDESNGKKRGETMKRGWSLMISCARVTLGLKRMGRANLVVLLLAERAR